MSTGSGFTTRELYTNGEEAVFDAARPVIVNGIDFAADRSDLVDRTVAVMLARITDDKRLTQREASKRYEEARPRILGGLLDALVQALRGRDSVKIDKSPRMADFYEVAVAAEPALGIAPGTFASAYAGSQEASAETVAESDIVVKAVRAFMARRALSEPTEWRGTAGELYAELGRVEFVGVDPRWKKYVPNPVALGKRLTRASPTLRQLGIIPTPPGPKDRPRAWHLEQTASAEPLSKRNGEASKQRKRPAKRPAKKARAA
jgi:hypothetical protein